jgi:Ca2+-transporting ATPase
MVFENEPSEQDVMQRPPRDANAPLFAGVTLGLALLQGLGVLLVVMGAYQWAAAHLSEGEARAFTFATLVSANLALILSNRSRAGSLWASLWVPNRTLWAVLAITLALLGLALYWPALARLFYFDTLIWPRLLSALALGLVSVIWFEAIKLSGLLSKTRTG